MAAVSVNCIIDAPPQDVWAELARIERHTEWMADAVALEFASSQRRGVGTKIVVETRVGPLRTTDEMEFVRWEPPHVMGVRHVGMVTGVGEFTLEKAGAGTRLTWRESLTFPWYFGSRLGARLAAPLLRRIWQGNLRRLAARF